MLKRISVKKKWQNELFRHKGINRIFSKFSLDSKEILIFNNFLREFFKNSGKRRIYTLMSSLDYEVYEKCFKKAAINVFKTLTNSHWSFIHTDEKCQFEIRYKNLEMIVILK